MKKNLIQALKKLLVAFGGAKNTSEVTDTNIVPIVDKLADAVGEYNPGGSSSTTDNGHRLYSPQTITTTTDLQNPTKIETLPSFNLALINKDNEITDSELIKLLISLDIKINDKETIQYQNTEYNYFCWYLIEDSITNVVTLPMQQFFESNNNDKLTFSFGSIEDFDVENFDFEP